MAGSIPATGTNELLSTLISVNIMKDLINLYYVSSPSSKEKRMRKHIKEWLKSNVPDAQMHADKSGIYVTKGSADSYPCVCAHIDEVHRERNKDFRVIKHEDYIFGYNVSSKEQYGIGADDKNGIWVAMQCLLRYDVLKVALFVGEEIGCVGSGDCNMAFFDDCRFVLQCDRRGSSDFITRASGWELCDDAFVEKIGIERFGYKVTSGLMTDVMELKARGLKVAACNLSCGYYNPHTCTETTVWSELCNCRDLVFHIIDSVTDVVPHAASRSRSTSYIGRGFGGWFGDALDDWYNDRWPSTHKDTKRDIRTRDLEDEFDVEEVAKQYSEMQSLMYDELSFDFNSFDLFAFYDAWKLEFPALDAHDYDDAYDELLCIEEDDEEQSASIG